MKAALRKRRALARRARARERFIATLRASGRVDALGALPKPDPERWLPKRERTGGRSKAALRRAAARGGKGAPGNVSSGGAQGGAGGGVEAVTASLDAQARADAAKLKAEAAPPAAAVGKKGATPAAPPPPALPPGVGKRKGGKK